MSRQGLIAEQLVKLQRDGVIRGWAKDADPRNPKRVHWVITIDDGNPGTRRYTTTEAEAFLLGVVTGYRHGVSL